LIGLSEPILHLSHSFRAASWSNMANTITMPALKLQLASSKIRDHFAKADTSCVL
jgi:hypothetical protein